MVEAVIFDYGGVISVPFLRDLDRFEAEMGYPNGSVRLLMFGESHSHLPDAAAEVHDFHRLETGEVSLDEYLQGLEQRAPEIIGQPIDFGAYLRFTQSTPIGVHWPVVHRIRALHAEGMKLGLLTNNVKEFGDSWRASFPAEELFEVIVDSCQVGLRKPDPRIYQLTCERLGVAPTSAVFVDDNIDNIEAAAALGIRTVLFGNDPLAAIAELDELLEGHADGPGGA
jgi:putative hydrolase of the HAD superfamily